MVVYVTSQDLVCKRRTKTTIQVGAGDSFSFKTQEGRQYKPRSRCVAKYKKSSSCSSLRLSCSKFSIRNRSPSCSRGDRLAVIVGGEATRYCQVTPPNMTFPGDLRLVFVSNKAGQSSGAECTVECTDGPGGNSGLTTGGCPGCPQAVEVSDLVKELAIFAANHPQFPLLSNCSTSSTSREVEVLDVSTQVVAGTNYFLTLEVSTKSGPHCDMLISKICRNVVIFRPLPVHCQGAPSSCDVLTRPEDIICMRGSVKPVHTDEGADGAGDANCICPALHAPVCAEDGQTYSNQCSAACRGLKTVCTGDCPCN